MKMTFDSDVVSRFADNLLAWLRRDWLALLLFGVAVIVMTYPLAFRLGEGLPSSGKDIFTSLWQVWWLGEVVENGHSANFTPYLFHPNGMDVTFQARRWAALGVWLPLWSLLGDIAGYNVSILLGLLASAYTAYLLIHYLTDNREAAWVGGAFYAFYPSHVVRVMAQPNTGSIQWIPLFTLALVAALDRVAGERGSRRPLSRQGLGAMVLTGLALSLNAYISIKPWLQAVLLGALYVPLAALANGWWRHRSFWQGLGVMAVCSGVLILPVVAPLVVDSAIGDAVSSVAPRPSKWFSGIDLLALIKASPDLPLFMPRSLARLQEVPFSEWYKGNIFYVGLASLAMAVAGLLDFNSRQRRRPAVWLAMALLFWGLSLGVVLRINDVRYREAWTPYQSVVNIPFFAVARTPHRFTLGFSLPWAVLVGYGVDHVRRRLDARRWLGYGVTGILAVLMLFELAEVPISLHPPRVSPAYEMLRDSGAEGAVIDLPIGNAKEYMYFQTIHQRPILEGKIARMPGDAYDYVDANPLLWNWKEGEALVCDYDVAQAIDDLYDDGFRYIVLHKEKIPHWLGRYFSGVSEIYRDETLWVFTVDSLRERPPCPREG